MLYKTKYPTIILYNSPELFIEHQYAYGDEKYISDKNEKFYEIINYETTNNFAVLIDDMHINFFDGNKFHKDIRLRKILINNKIGWISEWILEHQLEKI